MLRKCRYYNDHKTAAILMLDDFSMTAFAPREQVSPDRDWGLGLKTSGSLYSYLESTLLVQYPEIRGTIFYPVGRHSLQNLNAGYPVHFANRDSECLVFAACVIERFEFAFHGINHGRYIDPYNPCIRSNWKHEFEDWTIEDIPVIQNAIGAAEKDLGLRFQGGKYPGYMKNSCSEEILEKLGFPWWASSDEMVNRKHPGNSHRYIGRGKTIVDLPTNLCGNCFNFEFSHKKYPYLRLVKRKIDQLRLEAYLQYLYENQLIISIQEHFMGLRTDGRRQKPNLFDDINSLNRIYGMLRGADIWHTSCTDVARYLESYDHTVLEEVESGAIRIIYRGRQQQPFLSVVGKSRLMKRLEDNEIISGTYRNGAWVFNGISIGTYLEL